MGDIQVVPSVKHDEYVIINYTQMRLYPEEGFMVMSDGCTVSKDRMCREVIDSIIDDRHDFRSMGVYKLVKVDPKEVAGLVSDYLTSSAADDVVFLQAFDRMNEGSNTVVEPTNKDVELEVSKIDSLVEGLAKDIGRTFSR
jgi:hypothetical protein